MALPRGRLARLQFLPSPAGLPMSFAREQFAAVRDRDCRRELAAHGTALSEAFGDCSAGVAEARLVPGLSGGVLREIARLNKTALWLGPIEPALRRVDPAAAAWFDGYRLRTLALNRAALAAAGEVRAALDAAGTAHVFFKGPLLQAQLHGSPFLRPSADCDVLVQRAAFTAAAQALATRGYRATRGLGLWWSAFLGERHLAHAGQGAVIDLHKRLQQPGAPSPRAPGRFIDGRTELRVGGDLFPVLAAGHTCLLLSMTVVKSFRQREPCAGYVADLRAALDLAGPDADHLAARHALEPTLAFGRRAVDAVFGPHAPRRWGDDRSVLPGIGGDVLAMMLVAPWTSGLAWPRGRTLLWELCDRAPVRFGAEAAWTVASQTMLKGLGRLEGA